MRDMLFVCYTVLVETFELFPVSKMKAEIVILVIIQKAMCCNIVCVEMCVGNCELSV
jgi:hypothetical protein